MQRRRLITLVSLCAACGVIAVCSREDMSDTVEQNTDSLVVRPVASRIVPRSERIVSDEEIAAATAQAQHLADSTDHMLRQVHGLTMFERMHLRQDANAEQIARAKQLGIQQPIDLNAAVARHQLVRLADSTQYWTLHNLNFSVPYVTPSTEFMIAEIARRFQARLDSLHVPRYRLVITSALRTEDKQAALRRVNRNASKVESAHEFGTTIDIAYRRFAPPLNAAPVDVDTVRDVTDSIMVKTASLRSAELQAVLGRVILEMREQGMLMVMMERQQTVYHTTVGRPLVSPGRRVTL